MTGHVYRSRVAPLNRVRIDDNDVIGIVSALTFYSDLRCSVCVSWFSNGVHYEAWFDEQRLEVVP